MPSNKTPSRSEFEAEVGDKPSNMDFHPYARGSVVEVLHVEKEDAEDWWSEPESDSEVEDHDKILRLADVIDRAQNERGAWRYYVHYRGLNRRMDEWIDIHRIVSPPSIGNAKVKALKKEEERLKREEQKKEEDNKQALADASERSRGQVRRSGSQVGMNELSEDTTRRTRLRRKTSSTVDDDDTVVAANMDIEQLEENKPTESVPTVKKEHLTLSDAAVTTHQVGEHTLSTVKAIELDEHEGLDEASLREHEEVTKVKNVAFLELGRHQMETWYYSPLPKELLGSGGQIEVLYVCEFTFAMFARKSEFQRYQKRIPTHVRHPPGNEIYRKDNLAMFEVDGLLEKIYCQNLCYIAKLFLDHKTLYFDVDPFLFYVLCEVDDRGYHPVGYYSKEKYSDVGYNLACILTWPSYARKGYGRFLIAFSYELSKKEEKVGSPEKPMSDLGQAAYKPYWASTIIDFLLNQSDESSLSIMDISKRTSIMAEDIVFTLNLLGILKILNGVYFIAAEQTLLKGLAKKFPRKEPRVDPAKLHWTPFITDIKRDKFSIHAKKSSLDAEEFRGAGGFP